MLPKNPGCRYRRGGRYLQLPGSRLRNNTNSANALIRELRFDSGSCVRVKLAARFLFYLRFGDYNFKSFPILGQNVYTGGAYKKRSALKVSPCKKRSVLKVSPIPHARLPGCRHCPKAPTTQGVRPWVDSIVLWPGWRTTRQPLRSWESWDEITTLAWSTWDTPMEDRSPKFLILLAMSDSESLSVCHTSVHHSSFLPTHPLLY